MSLISRISDLIVEIKAAVDGKAAANHTHASTDVTGLGTAAESDAVDFATAAQGTAADNHAADTANPHNTTIANIPGLAATLGGYNTQILAKTTLAQVLTVLHPIGSTYARWPGSPAPAFPGTTWSKIGTYDGRLIAVGPTAGVETAESGMAPQITTAHVPALAVNKQTNRRSGNANTVHDVAYGTAGTPLDISHTHANVTIELWERTG